MELCLTPITPSCLLAVSIWAPANSLWAPWTDATHPSPHPLNYLSEAALNRDRIHVEVEWFIYLCEHKVLPGLSPLSEEQKKGLRAIVTDFNAESVAELAEIEAVTVHDVKAVEYYIGRRLKGLGLDHLVPLVHFGCTSEDINNLSYAWASRMPCRTCGSTQPRS